MSKNPNALNVIAAGLGLATVLAAFAHGLNFGTPTGFAYAIVAAITLVMVYIAFAAEYSMQWVGQSLAVGVVAIVFWLLAYPPGNWPIQTNDPVLSVAHSKSMSPQDFMIACSNAEQLFDVDRRFKHLNLAIDDHEQTVHLSGKVILTTDLNEACDELSNLGLKKFQWDVFVYQTNSYSSGKRFWPVLDY